MKTVDVKTSIIKPYKRNAKKHDQIQVERVAESIRQFGFVQPIVIDKENIVVIGHCRLMAAKQLGLDTVPCVQVDSLTEEEVAKLRLIDNKLNESEWDMDILSKELDGMDFEGFDFGFDVHDVSAFDEDAIQELFTDAPEKEKNPKKIQCPHCGQWFEV